MARTISQAFILGAGLGTRLRPITNAIPKVMVPITDGKPLLEHEIELLRDQGITDFLINLHYFPEAITSHFGDGSRWGVRIAYSDETGRLLETAGALKKAEHLLDNDFLFIYGDQLHFLDLRPLIERHLDNDALATITLKASDVPENGDIAEFDPPTGRIVRWHPRPHGIAALTDTLMLNAGIYGLSKEIIRRIPAGIPVKFDAEIIPGIMAEGGVLYAMPSREDILDIGTPEKYEIAKRYYRERVS